MNDFQNDMNHAVQGFVTQITELARRAAINTLESAFGGGSTRGGGRALTPPAAGASVGRARRGRGAKRTAADLEALSEKVASFVKAHPGMRVEQINKELGTTTKDLALPIRKLVSDGMIAAKGKKRATAYFPGRKAK
jgi:hypothetical protein